MGYALPITVEMTDMECGNCGISFSVPEIWRAEKQKTGQGWYCPNGHSRVYRESDADRYKKQLLEEKERHERTLARFNEAIEEKKKAASELKRIKTRTSAGVCPCCNRTFEQLARHMKSKHPEQLKK